METGQTDWLHYFGVQNPWMVWKTVCYESSWCFQTFCLLFNGSIPTLGEESASYIQGFLEVLHYLGRANRHEQRKAAWMAIFPTKWRNKWANEQILLGGVVNRQKAFSQSTRRNKRFPGHSMFFWMVFTPNTSPPKGTFEDVVPFPKVGFVRFRRGQLKRPPCCLLRA